MKERMGRASIVAMIIGDNDPPTLNWWRYGPNAEHLLAIRERVVVLASDHLAIAAIPPYLQDRPLLGLQTDHTQLAVTLRNLAISRFSGDERFPASRYKAETATNVAVARAADDATLARLIGRWKSPSRRALLIGSTWNSLKGIESSMHAIRKCLESWGFGSVETLLGPDVTKKKAQSALDRFAARVRPDDVALIYFAGHGSMENVHVDHQIHDASSQVLHQLGRAAQFRPEPLLPADAGSDGGDIRSLGALEISVWTSRIGAVASSVVVIMDCCFANPSSRVGSARKHWYHDHKGSESLRGAKHDRDAVWISCASSWQANYAERCKGGGGEEEWVCVFSKELSLAFERLNDGGRHPLRWDDVFQDMNDRLERKSSGDRFWSFFRIFQRIYGERSG